MGRQPRYDENGNWDYNRTDDLIPIHKMIKGSCADSVSIFYGVAENKVEKKDKVVLDKLFKKFKKQYGKFSFEKLDKDFRVFFPK